MYIKNYFSSLYSVTIPESEVVSWFPLFRVIGVLIIFFIRLI